VTDDASRQSFLGNDSERIFALCKVGVVGLSGGGSHIVQQSAHVGVLNYVAIDPKCMAQKHLHRLVGGTAEDVKRKTPKAKIAERIIKGIRPSANVEAVVGTWQENQLSLRDCTVIFGCVDSYSEREQLDRFCRRFLIPFIDIGMDVFALGDSYHIVGQTVLSSPGHPCLRCMGIVTEENLKEEAAKYGAAGPRAQVIWPNAVLASSAVGLFVQLVCPWYEPSSASAYLEYNGNTPSLTSSPRMEFVINTPCPHFLPTDIGDPLFNLETIYK
jgi:hypothetical protein